MMRSVSLLCGEEVSKEKDLKEKDTSEKISSRKNKLFSGIAILTVSTFIVKILGLFCKIPLLKYLGSEGMGYFNSAYEIFALLGIISSAGLPVAVSMLISASISKNKDGEGKNINAGAYSVYRVALRFFLIIGAVGSAFMMIFAPAISEYIKNSSAVFCIAAVAPSLFFVCGECAIRGFFQGYGEMLPTAVSQIIEAAGKLILGVSLAIFAIKKGYEIPIVAAFAVSGISIGSLIALIYLVIAKRTFLKKRNFVKPGKILFPSRIAASLVKLAIPITLTSFVTGLGRFIDMGAILRGLSRIGYSQSSANSLYGCYATLALPVFALIPSLVTSVSIPLVPAVSGAVSSNDKKEGSEIIIASLRLCAMFAIPCALGIAIFPDKILSLLFGSDKTAVAIASPLLSILAASVFPASIICTTTSILQSSGRVYLPVISMSCGIIFKIISSRILISIPGINIYGAPISTLICDSVAAGMNIFFICITLHNSDKLSFGIHFFKILLCSAISVLSAAAAGIFLPKTHISFFVIIFIAAVVYIAASLISGNLDFLIKSAKQSHH